MGSFGTKYNDVDGDDKLCWTNTQCWSAGLWNAPFPNHEICWRCVIEHELYVTMYFFMNVRYKCALFYSPCMYLTRINLLIPLMFLVVVCLTIQTHHLLRVCQRRLESLHTVAVFFHVCDLWGRLQFVWMTGRRVSAGKHASMMWYV